MKTWTFISKNKKLCLVLSHGIPSEPLTGRNATPGEYARFEDGILRVSNEELAKKLINHDGFDMDYILAEDGQDPYARKPGIEHDRIEINYGHIGKNLNPKKGPVISPELKMEINKMADARAEKKFNELIGAFKAGMTKDGPGNDPEGTSAEEETEMPEETKTPKKTTAKKSNK